MPPTDYFAETLFSLKFYCSKLGAAEWPESPAVGWEIVNGPLEPIDFTD